MEGRSIYELSDCDLVQAAVGEGGWSCETTSATVLERNLAELIHEPGYLIDLTTDGRYLVATFQRDDEVDAAGEPAQELIWINPESWTVARRFDLPWQAPWYLVGGDDGRVLLADSQPGGALLEVSVAGVVRELSAPGHRLITDNERTGHVGAEATLVPGFVLESSAGPGDETTVAWDAQGEWSVVQGLDLGAPWQGIVQAVAPVEGGTLRAVSATDRVSDRPLGSELWWGDEEPVLTELDGNLLMLRGSQQERPLFELHGGSGVVALDLVDQEAELLLDGVQAARLTAAYGSEWEFFPMNDGTLWLWLGKQGREASWTVARVESW